jgi:signal transduction histidine kinase
MLAPKQDRNKIITLAAITALTVAIHYGYVFQPLFGHVHWIHALHGRFCYIPIVIAASWFGIRGGIYSATAISILVLPFVFGSNSATLDTTAELVEIIFYFFIGSLIGWLVDREFLARQKQQEAELQVERAQRLSLVGQIAAGVAHEIKNPLASIKGAADILVDDSTPETARKEFSEILQSEVRRIDSTVSEFLGFARPKETRLEKTDLTRVINSCVRQVFQQAEQAGVRIESDIADDISVTGDAEKLHQLTLNLILNSINASPDGGTIIVSLKKAGDHLGELIVSDDGVGMKAEQLVHAFEPFYTTTVGGTGLGLAIVKSIVERHHGTIELTSTIESGTEAKVTIPLLSTGGGA